MKEHDTTYIEKTLRLIELRKEYKNLFKTEYMFREDIEKKERLKKEVSKLNKELNEFNENLPRDTKSLEKLGNEKN